jgi:large subunit ribosomal protein L15e
MSFTKQFKKVSVNIRKKVKDSDYDYRKLYSDKMIALRKKKASIVKLDKPSNLVKARALGYKAKEGIFVAMVKVRKGTGAFSRPSKGRKPKKTGYLKLTRKVSIQRIAEQRASRKFSNAEVLNSYWIGEDGKDKYYEVILVDKNHPAILADKAYSGIAKKTGRAERGLTSAGKKGRGLDKKGKGTEKNRPSIRSKGKKAK